MFEILRTRRVSQSAAANARHTAIFAHCNIRIELSFDRSNNRLRSSGCPEICTQISDQGEIESARATSTAQQFPHFNTQIRVVWTTENVVYALNLLR